MKLLIVYHSGLSEETRAFYREYVRQGIDLKVIIPSKVSVDKTDSSLGYLSHSDEYNERGYSFIPVDLRKPSSYGEGFKFFQLFRAIKRVKPDIIHVFDEYSSFYLSQTILCRNILYGKKVPVLAYASQNIPFKSPPFILEFSPRFFKRIVRKLLHPLIFAYHKKYLNAVTGCNSEALKNIKTLGVNIPMRLVFWGIDFSIFRPQNRDLCREKIGIPKNIKLIGYIGRLLEEKGLDKLVMALSKINRYYLILPSEGEYKKELDKMINSLGVRDRVYYYNNVDRKKLVDYYNCLDVFVLPSQTTSDWKEQYGRVLVEAMGCHIPVIGSSSGAIPEVLKDYPKHLIFREDSIDDLIDKINKIEKLKFPENFDINNFLRKFSLENFIREYIDFYKSLKNGKI